MRTAIFISVLFILLSCQKNQKISEKQLDFTAHAIEYAKGFKISEYSNYNSVEILSPWVENTVLARYYLVSNDSIVTPKDGIKILIPVRNIAATSATHLGFLQELNALNMLSAVCSPDLIFNSQVRDMWTKGKLTDLGDAFNINTEKSIALQPDLVMISGYKQDDPYAKRLTNAGISVVLNNEWMEESLLARAEWIKFVGAFLKKDALADSVFNSVKKEYLRLSDLANAVENKPLILTGSNFRGTWYMPGGKSYMAKMYMDAGADYFYAQDTSLGSIPLQIENVISKFSNADIWLNCNFSSIEELLLSDSKHGFFQAVKTKNVFNFNKRMLPSTANDFWESAVVHPELLLKDVVKILHPELLPEHELFYSLQLP